MIAIFPVTTDRLLLRSFRAEDAAAKFRLDGDPAIQKYLGGPMTQERSLALLHAGIDEFNQRGYGLIALEEIATQQVIGYGLLQREPSRDGLELVLALAPEGRGRGLALEAGKALLAVACTHLHAKEIIGRVKPCNIKSLALLKELGMTALGEREDPLHGPEHIYVVPCGQTVDAG